MSMEHLHLPLNDGKLALPNSSVLQIELDNGTALQEFILLGFGTGKQVTFLLLIFFTILYILTVGENITITALVLLDSHLAWLPMCILLGNFSWLEICYVSTTVPRMLFHLASSQRIISFHACILQFYFLFSFGTTENVFLSTMALDQYLAICHPLRYPQMMSHNFCYVLVVTCGILGFLWYPIPVILISKLSFCGPNIIDCFLCDPGPIVSLACPPLGNTPTLLQVAMNAGVLMNVLFVVVSYSIMILTLIKTSNQGSHRKAFSTIFIHIAVVTLFCGSIAGMYLSPDGENQSGITKAVTLFYFHDTLSEPPDLLSEDQSGQGGNG